MSVVDPKLIAPDVSLIVGARVSVHDDEAVVKEVARTSTGTRVRVQYNAGMSEWIEVPGAAEKARTPPAAPVRHAAPAARAAAPARASSPDTSKMFEKLADDMLKSMRSYVDAKFVGVIKYLPNGAEHRSRMAEEVAGEIQKLLERHQRDIRDDVEFLKAAMTRMDAVEARLKLLENPHVGERAA